jgi:SAM-dependent methyltransferase
MLARPGLALLRITLRERTVPVRPLVRHVSAAPGADVGLDYDRAGERYRAYADGDVDKLYEFDGQYAYGDQEIWRILGNTLNKLRARGRRELSVLDLGCGPGTWLRRTVDWAAKMGFTRITARGVDLAEAQVRRARLLSQEVARHAGVSLRYEVGDIRERMPEPDCSVDICLCLYGVLNHLPADDLSTVLGEVARATKGRFVATFRAIGSTPTIYVDGVKAAKAYHQDNARGRLQVEFQNGAQTSFPSHLFSAAEIRALATPALEIEELSGLDLSMVASRPTRTGIRRRRRPTPTLSMHCARSSAASAATRLLSITRRISC